MLISRTIMLISPYIPLCVILQISQYPEISGISLLTTRIYPFTSKAYSLEITAYIPRLQYPNIRTIFSFHKMGGFLVGGQDKWPTLAHRHLAGALRHLRSFFHGRFPAIYRHLTHGLPPPAMCVQLGASTTTCYVCPARPLQPYRAVFPAGNALETGILHTFRRFVHGNRLFLQISHFLIGGKSPARLGIYWTTFFRGGGVHRFA